MRKLVIGLALASTALTTPALARDGQWYVGVEGGAMLVEDIQFDVGAVNNGVTLDTDTGYDVGGIVGYDFGPFRLEAEVSYRESDVTDVLSTVAIARGAPLPALVGRSNAVGSANVLAFMLNGLVDFGPDDGLQGFVGGGVGVARTDITAAATNPGRAAFLNDSDTGFAWQILAGVRAPLSDSWDVGLKYRFFNSDSVSLIDAGGRDFDGRFRSHSILGSIIYNFGGEEAAPPPPPPVCEKGPYIVFFDFDKSNITPEAATILDNAVAAYGSCGSVPVMLAGHADRSGAATYNVGLSQRRAESVKSYLVSRNIPASAISTQAFGETRNRVTTADGVRELQNRRVEITYGPGSGM